MARLSVAARLGQLYCVLYKVSGPGCKYVSNQYSTVRKRRLGPATCQQGGSWWATARDVSSLLTVSQVDWVDWSGIKPFSDCVVCVLCSGGGTGVHSRVRMQDMSPRERPLSSTAWLSQQSQTTCRCNEITAVGQQCAEGQRSAWLLQCLLLRKLMPGL